MRVNDFLNLVARETQKQLPARYRRFHTWKRYTLIQLFYKQRTIHYEIWVRGGEIRALEIGLHCEADAATNTKLLQLFDAHLIEIKHALGDQIEAEQWTKSWTRVHELMPYKTLDESTARQCAARLALMIQFFEPMLAAGTERSPQRSPASPQRSPASPQMERNGVRSLQDSASPPAERNGVRSLRDSASKQNHKRSRNATASKRK